MPTFRLAKTGFRFNALHSFPDDSGYDRLQHGHDYEFTVMLEGELDGAGVLYDLRGLKAIVETSVLAVLDHQNLDGLLAHPSLEALAQWIWNQLRRSVPAPLRVGVTLWETRSLYVEFWGT